MKPLPGDNYWVLLRHDEEIARRASRESCLSAALNLDLVLRTPADDQSDGHGLSLQAGVTIAERQPSIADLAAPLSASKNPTQYSISGNVLADPGLAARSTARSLQAAISARRKHPPGGRKTKRKGSMP